MSDLTPHIEPSLSPTGSLAPKYFDELYAARRDPWEFATSRYEAEKYAATLAALPRPLYARALELGCSIGILTRQLAERCEALLATDVSAPALEQARENCKALEQIRFEKRDLAMTFPEGHFDLILVSEIGYYFSPRDLSNIRTAIARALTPGGHLLLVHYTGETNYPLTGDAVHDLFRARSEDWHLLREQTEEIYRLDLFERSHSNRLGLAGASLAAGVAGGPTG